VFAGVGLMSRVSGLRGCGYLPQQSVKSACPANLHDPPMGAGGHAKPSASVTHATPAARAGGSL
jgi:hypothetical protein